MMTTLDDHEKKLYAIPERLISRYAKFGQISGNPVDTTEAQIWWENPRCGNTVFQVRRTVEETFEVHLVLTGKLDRELNSGHELTVVAFDGGQPPRSATLTIDVVVTDSNDNSPRFASPSYEVMISKV